MLEQLLSLEIYQFIFVFIRIGAFFAFAPGFSTSYVPIRARLSIALAICLIVTPVIHDKIPPLPPQAFELLKEVFFESTIGVFYAFFMRMMVSAVDLAGEKISMALSFSNAQAFDATTDNQSMLVTSLMSYTVILIMFATNTHYLMIEGIIESYDLFKPGMPLPVDDFVTFLSETMNESFIIGFRISAPFIIFSIILYGCMGLISRLMPQFQIFFLMLPLQVYLGLSLFMITFPVIMTWFFKYYENGLLSFIN